MAPIEITIALVYKEPPTSGRFLIPESGQSAWSRLKISIENGPSHVQTGRHTHHVSHAQAKPHPFLIYNHNNIIIELVWYST